MAEVVGTKVKAPGETKDVGLDWSELVAARSTTVSASDWDVPTGILETTADRTTTHTVVRLTGGTAGTAYTVTNTATLANGEVLQRAVVVEVE